MYVVVVSCTVGAGPPLLAAFLMIELIGSVAELISETDSDWLFSSVNQDVRSPSSLLKHPLRSPIYRGFSELFISGDVFVRVV